MSIKGRKWIREYLWQLIDKVRLNRSDTSVMHPSVQWNPNVDSKNEPNWLLDWAYDRESHRHHSLILDQDAFSRSRCLRLFDRLGTNLAEDRSIPLRGWPHSMRYGFFSQPEESPIHWQNYCQSHDVCSTTGGERSQLGNGPGCGRHTFSSSDWLDVGVDGLVSGLATPDWTGRGWLMAISACPLP